MNKKELNQRCLCSYGSPRTPVRKLHTPDPFPHSAKQLQPRMLHYTTEKNDMLLFFRCSPPLSPYLVMKKTLAHFLKLQPIFFFLNTFAASYLNTQGLNNSCLKSPASTLVDLTFQSRALRSFSLNQLCSLSL